MLTIKIDLNLRVEMYRRIYSFPLCLLLKGMTEKWPEAIMGPKHFSKTGKTLSRHHHSVFYFRDFRCEHCGTLPH